MAKFHWEGTTRAGEKRRGVDGGGDRARSSRTACAATASPSRASRRRRLGRSSASRSARASPRRTCQIFTRQLATMIDAGLPLVQCLDILANQTREQDRSRSILAQVKNSVEQGATFSDALTQAPEGVRRPLRQPRRRRRDRRHPRHDPEPPRDLHREGRQAEGPDQERDVLPDRHPRRRDRRHRRHARSRSSRRSRTCIKDMGNARAARRRRTVVIGISHAFIEPAGTSSSARCSASSFGVHRACDAPKAAARRSTACCCKMPVIGAVAAQDRRRALHAHARHPALLRRADPRRARHLRAHRRQPRRPGRHPARARQDLRRSRHGRPARRVARVPDDGRPDDRRRRADRRDGPDAPEDRRLLRRRGRRRRRRR